MLYREILIRERLGSVDTRRTRSIAVEEITTLAHEILDLKTNNQSASICQSDICIAQIMLGMA